MQENVVEQFSNNPIIMEIIKNRPDYEMLHHSNAPMLMHEGLVPVPSTKSLRVGDDVGFFSPVHADESRKIGWVIEVCVLGFTRRQVKVTREDLDKYPDIHEPGIYDIETDVIVQDLNDEVHVTPAYLLYMNEVILISRRDQPKKLNLRGPFRWTPSKIADLPQRSTTMKLTISESELERSILLAGNLIQAVQSNAQGLEKTPVFNVVNNCLEDLSGTGKTGRYAAYFQMQASLMCARMVSITTFDSDGEMYFEVTMETDVAKGNQLVQSATEITKSAMKVVNFVNALKPIIIMVPIIETIVNYVEDQFKLLVMKLLEINKKD